MSWGEILKRYGFSTLIALALLWFLMSNVAQAIKDHDANTTSVLLRVCIHTAIIAKVPPSDCFRP